MYKSRCKGVILFIIFILASSSSLLALEIFQVQSTEENAAVYYQKAFSLLPEMDFRLWRRFDAVREKGWVQEDIKLRNILNASNSALKEFEKGLKLDKCDFSYIRPFKYFSTKPIPNPKARDLCNLKILQARLYEKDGKLEKAMKEYQDILKFANHISQGRSSVEVTLGKGIAYIVYIPLSQYISHPAAKRKILLKTVAFLNEWERKEISVKEAFEYEKRATISDLKQMRDDAIKELQEDILDPAKLEEAKEVFENNFVRLGNNLADKYFGNFIKAAKTNSPADWTYAENERKALDKETQIASTEDLVDAFKYAIKVYSLPTDVLSMQAKRIIAITTSHLKKMAENNYHVLAKFRILKSALAVRTYSMDKKNLPDTLSHLVPTYLNELPKDPFSDKILQYKREGEKCLIYSVGPDRKDDLGKIDHDKKNRATFGLGDIVFRF